MPTVGQGTSHEKHYPYTPKGEEQAKAEAKRTGQKLTMARSDNDRDDRKSGKVMSTGQAAKKARSGADMGKPGKNFSKIAESAGKKYGSAEAGKRVAGAVFQAKRRAGTL